MNVSVSGDATIEPFNKFFEKAPHGLMGPSGCGKTTLLNRIFKKYDNIAYVPQDPPIHAFEFLTVRECVRLSVELSPRHEVDAECIVRKMELEHCADSTLGKISGGEKKRCAIAMELCHEPSMVLFDEPFSSLDSRTTVVMFNFIKNTMTDMPLLITVHQPSGYIFFNLSNIMFMKKGRIVYDGRPDGAQNHFEMMGFIKPDFSSVHEFVIDVCQQMDIENVTSHSAGVFIDDATTSARVYRGFEFYKIKPLVSREFAQNVRNPLLLKTKVVQSVVFGLFVGLLYFRMGNSQVDVQNKTGAMFFMIINQIMSNVFSTVDAFPSNLKMFKYDYERKKYNLFIYYFIKTTIDVPFVVTNALLFSLLAGIMTNITRKMFQLICVLSFVAVSGSSFGYFMSSLSEQHTVCLVASNLCVLPMMLTSGFFVNNQSVPPYISWIRFVNPFYYGYNALSTAVWDDVTLACEDDLGCMYNTGRDVLDYQGIDGEHNVSILFGLIILYRTLGYAYLCVRFSRTRV